MQHTAELVDESQDTVLYLDEIDIETASLIVKSGDSNDPFTKADGSLSRKYQQKKSRMQKRMQGADGTKSDYKDPEVVTAYGLFELVTPPYDLDALALLYDESYILRGVVDARATNTVGLGISWKPTTKAFKQIERAAGDEEKAARVRNAHLRERDRMIELFENFNEDETMIESLMKAWTDYLALGNGYVEIGRNRRGKIAYVGHIPGQQIRLRKKRDGFVQQANQYYTFFRNFGDRETVDPINGDPNPNEIIHFKMYSPTNAYYGVPPSVSAISAIVGDKFAKEYNIDYFENKAIPRYAIILKGVKLSAKSKQELIAYFRNEVKGKNHGTLVIPLPATIGNQSDADVKFEKLEADVQDASFEKYRKSNQEEVLVAYRTPPTKVAIFENANLAVSRDADKTFKEQVVGPDQQTAENRVNKIVKEFTDLLIIEFNKFDIIDEDTRSRINDRYLRTQVTTPNEVRSEIGKQALPGGDQALPYTDPNLKYTATALTQNELRELASFDPKPGGDELPPSPKEQMDAQMKLKQAASGGSQPGNTSGSAGTAPKSRADSGKTRSDASTSGTRAERGERQDTGQGRDRS